MNEEIAKKIVGSLSEPSKMPCHSWSISAKTCKTGAKLRKIKNSVCNKCYAFRGRYAFPCVIKVQKIRQKGLKSPFWADAMAFLIRSKSVIPYFRFFDAGDLQDLDHLVKIVQIANLMPDFKFWLPTKEYGIIREYIHKYGQFPDNLNVRLSAYMIDSEPPTSIAQKFGCTTSTVVSQKINVSCPSMNQGNKCLTCRACWDKEVKNVAYHVH
jgi:hypothetical protein